MPVGASKKRIIITAAVLGPLLAIGFAWAWYLGVVLPERRALEELGRLAEDLAPVLRAETLDPERLTRAREHLKVLTAQGRAGQELLSGAAAFLADDLKEADRRLATARSLAPEEPYLASFRAAVNLRQGNTALAKEMYLKSLALKSQANFKPVTLTDDQLGLALGLFMLHRPAEALPLAEQAWQARHKYLGADDPDTLAAANRLATIYVALKENSQAEDLLKMTYQAALLKGPEAAAALEETRLLLTILYNQTGRLGELQELFSRDSDFGPGEIEPPKLASLAGEGGWTEAGPSFAPGFEPEFVPEFTPVAPTPVTPPEPASAPEPAPVLPPEPAASTPTVTLEPEPLATEAAPAGDAQAEPPAPLLVAPDQATPENLAFWEKTAQGLVGHDDDLAIDLWDKIIFERQRLDNLEPQAPALRPAQMALVRACLDTGQYERAAEELQPLLNTAGGQASDDFLTLSALMAESLEGEGRWREAETHWLAAAEAVDDRLEARTRAKKGFAAEDVARSLDVHLKLAENILHQGRGRLEAEIELRAAVGRLGQSPPLGEYPGLSRVYLRLARLAWDSRQTDNSAEFYRLAQASAEASLANDPEASVRESLTEVLEEAQAEARDLAAKKSPPKPAKKGAARDRDPKSTDPPSPEQMRLTLDALSALGRLAEFQDRLTPVLGEVARRFGEGSREYMAYYSLKLKGLEEEGRLDELTAELAARAEFPPGRNEAERALNRGSALIYAARVNERAGRMDAAANFYQQALVALSGRSEETLVARRRSVEEALVRLKGPSVN